MSLTVRGRVCKCSFEFGFRWWWFRRDVVHPMEGNQRRNKFRSSLTRCFCFSVVELESFCLANRFDLLLRWSWNFLTFACHWVDSVPTCNFWKKLSSQTFNINLIQPTLAMEPVAKLRCCASSSYHPLTLHPTCSFH